MITQSEDVEAVEREQEIISEFKDKCGRYKDYWDPIYKECDKHLRFVELGKQFEDGEAKAYGLKKPIQPNLLLTYANHEANKTLQTDYRGKVSPNGGGADMIKARERQDVLRGLQRLNKDAEINNAVRRKQVMGGIAYSIAKLEYSNKRGYGKTLSDEFIEDWRNVYPDITTKSPTMADIRDFIIRQEVPKAQWKEMTGEDPEGWGSTRKKVLWHYWVREDVEDTEYLGLDGNSKMGSELEEGEEGAPDLDGIKTDEDGNPLSRPTLDYTWCWYKITDDDRILDQESWLGAYPPLVACTGRRVIDNSDGQGDGKVYYQPLTQFAEQPQKMYTIISNIIALRLSRSPYSKWKVAAETINIKDMIALRQAAMLGDMDILYKGLADDGKTTLPAPEEMEPKVLDAILLDLLHDEELKIQKIFGIFDANLGNRSNEQSGVAIEERAKGGELSNFDLQFNYMNYVEQKARVKLDLIPKYLTAAQQIPFVDDDDQVVLQWINTEGGKSFSPNEEYSLSIEAMPISQTAREDEAAALRDMAKVMPVIAQNPQAVALIVKAQPGRYSSQIADFIAQGDPQLAQAKQTIAQLQGELQKSQAKQMQDAQTIQMLKGTAQVLKQQMSLMKQQHAVDGQTAEMKSAFESAQAQAQAAIDQLELQVKQYEAESGRITAEAAMLKVVGDLTKPEPATPALGQGLP